MTTKLITVQRAESEIRRLQHLIALGENYEADTSVFRRTKKTRYKNEFNLKLLIS